jgi:hypothetical protein
MTLRRTALCLVALCLVGGPVATSPAATADASVRQELLRGVAQIRGTHDRKQLQSKLSRTLASLRRAHASTPAERQAKALAVQGFESTLAGIASLLDFSENDSGELAAATRDAKRADRDLTRGANQLRAAGRALGIRIGSLNGY